MEVSGHCYVNIHLTYFPFYVWIASVELILNWKRNLFFLSLSLMNKIFLYLHKQYQQKLC